MLLKQLLQDLFYCLWIWFVVLCCVILIAQITGCCKKPICNPVNAPIVVTKPCVLPPVPQLAKAIPTTLDCPENYICFNQQNSGNLWLRDRMLTQWVREVLATCK